MSTPLKMPVARHGRCRGGLVCGTLAAIGVGMSAPAAMARQDDGVLTGNSQPGQTQLPRGATRQSQWTLSSSLFYSDNFRRVSEDQNRIDVYLADFDLDPSTPDEEQSFLRLSQEALDENGNFILDDNGVPVIDDNVLDSFVNVDTPDNLIATISVSGATFVDRPALSGLLSGSIRVGAYADQDPVSDRMLASSSALAPDDVDLIVSVGSGAVLLPMELQRSFFSVSDAGDVFVDPNITGAATVRLVEDFFYIDGSALAFEQTLGRTNVLVQEGVGQPDEEVTYGGLSISPYLQRTLGQGSVVEVRARATVINVLDERFDDEESDAEDGGQFSNDSTSAEFQATVDSGLLLSKLNLIFGGLLKNVQEEGGRVNDVDFDQTSVSLDGEYSLTSTLGLRLGTGYDDFTVARRDGTGEDEGLNEDDLSGAYWSAGFSYQPSRRTRLVADVGERFGGRSLRLNFNASPSRTISLAAQASRVVTTGTQDAVDNRLNFQSTAFSALQRLSALQGNSASRVLDRVLAANGAGFQGASTGQLGVAAVDRYSVRLGRNGRRTNLAAELSFSDSAFSADRSTELTSLSLTADRQITRAFSVGARLRLADTLNETRLAPASDAGEDATGSIARSEIDETFVGLNASYNLGQRLGLTASIYRLDSDAVGVAATGTGLDFVENAASLGLRWRF